MRQKKTVFIAPFLWVLLFGLFFVLDYRTDIYDSFYAATMLTMVPLTLVWLFQGINRRL